jgi:hypothetical protein
MFASIKGLFLFGKVKRVLYKQKLSLVHYQQMNGMSFQEKVRKRMVPPAYLSFFITAASAGGALIGLLFVAVSIAPHRTVQASAPVVSRVMASSTFTALLNAFFISLGAVLPHLNIGVITLIVSLIGVTNSMSHGWLMLRP